MAQLVALQPVRTIHSQAQQQQQQQQQANKRKAETIDSPPPQEDEQRVAKRRQVAEMIEELIQESSAREIQEKDQQLQQQAKQIQELQQDNKKLEAEKSNSVQFADSYVNKLEDALKASEAQEVVLDDTKLKLATAVSANATISTAVAQLQQDIAKLERESTEAKAQRQQDIAKLEREKMEAKALLKQDIATLQREATEAKAQRQQDIAKLEQEATEAKAQLKQDLAKRQQDFDKLKQEATEAKDQLNQDLAKRQLYIAKLEQEATEAKDHLKQDLAQRQQDFDKLKQEATEAKAQFKQDFDKLNQEATEAKAQFKQDFDKLKQEATEAKAQFKQDFDKLNQEATEAKAQFKQDFDKLKQEATEAKDQLNQDLAQRQQDLDKLKQDLAQTNAINAELAAKEAVADKSLARAYLLTMTNADLTAELQKCQDSVAEKVASSTQLLKDSEVELQNEVARLDQQLKQQTTDIAASQTLLDQEKAKVLALREQMVDMNARIQELQAAQQAPPQRPDTTCRPFLSFAATVGGGGTAVHPHQQQGHCGYPRQQHIQPVYIVPPQSGQLNQPRGNEWSRNPPLGPKQQDVGQVFAGAGEGFLAQVGGDGELPLHNPTDAARLGGANYNAAAPPQVSAGVPQGGQAADENDEEGEVDDAEDEEGEVNNENLFGDADRDTHPNSGSVWPETPAQFLRQDDDDENT